MSDRAKSFAELHAGPKLLILPNAWDAGSARVIEHAGAKAIATSSAAVAWAHGYADGEHLPFEALLETVREIAATVSVPVSADIESAYAEDAAGAAETVARIRDVGAVGINIEDGNAPPDVLARKIGNLRKASSDLWINARVDTYLRNLVPAERAFDETVARAAQYREAGASSIFVPALTDLPAIEKMVTAVVLPLNVLAWAGLPDGAALEKAGVRRLSAGSGLGMQVLNHAFALAKGFLSDGRSETFAGGALNNPAINGLMRKR